MAFFVKLPACSEWMKASLSLCMPDAPDPEPALSLLRSLIQQWPPENAMPSAQQYRKARYSICTNLEITLRQSGRIHDASWVEDVKRQAFTAEERARWEQTRSSAGKAVGSVVRRVHSARGASTTASSWKFELLKSRRKRLSFALASLVDPSERLARSCSSTGAAN